MNGGDEMNEKKVVVENTLTPYIDFLKDLSLIHISEPTRH